MARIRTIKPEYFTSLSVASLDLAARLTFIGLWTHCDDEGRCVDEARLIKAAIWPLDDRTAADVEGDLCTIHKVGLIIRYEVGGRRYLAVTGWKEHQRINRPSPSRIPPPPPERGPHGGLSEPSVNAHADPQGGAREPSSRPDMSDSKAGGNQGGASASISGDEPPPPPATCPNVLMEDSVSPHGGLTEGSPPERKGTGNREQGTERECGRAGEDAPSSAGASLAPLATPIDIAALDDEIADELSQRTGLDITAPYVGWVREKLLADAPEVIGNVSLWVRGQIRATEDIRVFLTPNMAAAYTARRRPTVVAAASQPSSKPTSAPLPDNFRLTDSMRRWAVSTFPAVDVDYETAQFVSHHRSRATESASWPDEWQKWVRRAHKYATDQAARRPAQAGNSPMPQAAAGNARALTAADRRLASNLDAVAWAAEQDRLEALQKGNPL